MPIQNPWTPFPKEKITIANRWYEVNNQCEKPTTEDTIYILSKLMPGVEFTDRNGTIFYRHHYPELHQ